MYAKIALPTFLLVMPLTGCGASPEPRSPATADESRKSPSPASRIDRAQVEAAQASWCAALVDIGKAAGGGGDAKALGTTVLSTAYDYDEGVVLFKPTLTFGDKTFRMTKAGALAYFVGSDAAFSDDKGFALKPWTKCTSRVVGVLIDGDVALAMGNVHLEAGNGDAVVVDKTFGYRRDANGALRIVLHHSSLPYVPTR